ncbi:acetyl-CoA synthetase-like protein [Aspergillus eucalypticola CBS 122712]|uniref:Acetyl-CoA synthetase-like protein n=1 Tax=Aspergillus eucalypticola (strain CBS 122712 / IBT 29274) TaxID=1448314 RepID=A0A317UWD9_ASPEC|nr:acetyl-CoA synthetase-like protein [Aspergillus eucalypticola CBS 122712]PWY64802.1 acetyl-CoA synthetase-like protein [Aspergillus eucalypticola CBS 122712]
MSCFPDLCAVSTDSRSLSYRELSCFLGVVSSQINELTQRGDVICVISDGTIEWLVAILAVIQSGCTYCPVDVKLPRARQHCMIESASAKVVLFPRANMRTGYGFLGDVKALDESKGVPKAVQLAHKGIMSLLSCPEGRLYSKPGWRIAQTLSLGFDCCVLEVLSATCFGGTLVLKDVNDPLAHLNKVDAMVSTPSLLATLDPEDYRNLQVVYLLGEALHQNLLDKWRPGRVVHNCYGPAECTLFATFKCFDDAAHEQVSIGRPTPRTRIYMLDKKQRPVPVGVKGEIYISGIQVTPGYRNNAVQTASAFLPDLHVGGSQKMFRTGDMGHLMRDGNIEYIGREDDLFKIRGFRVDLGDIEASILALAPDLDNIAVVVAASADNLIKTAMLDQAFREFVQEREVFLSRYKQVKSRANFLETSSTHRLPSSTLPNTELSIDEFLHAARNYRSDLANEQPVQALLYQHSLTESTLVILMSHLVGDAITMNVFLNSLAVRFQALSRRVHTDPGCLSAGRQTHTYIDWTVWSATQEYLSAESHRPRSYTGGTKSWTLPSSLSNSLQHLCADISLSPHQLMLAAVTLATQALRPSQDIVMMAPYSLRTEPLTEELAGCLLDRVPIRVKWDRQQSLLELLRAVQQSSQTAIAHAVPYASLCKALQLPPSLTNSLAEIMVTFHPASSDETRRSFGQPFNLRPSGAKFPVLFEFFQQSPDETITVFFEHDDALLSGDDSEALMSAFQLVLQLIAQHQTVHEIVDSVCREARILTKHLNGPVESHF